LLVMQLRIRALRTTVANISWVLLLLPSTRVFLVDMWLRTVTFDSMCVCVCVSVYTYV